MSTIEQALREIQESLEPERPTVEVPEPEVTAATPGANDALQYERVEQPAKREDQAGFADGNYSKLERIERPAEPEALSDDDIEAINRKLYGPSVRLDKDFKYNRDSANYKQFRRDFDTFATGATLGAYDELAGAFFGDETKQQIRRNVAQQAEMYPTRSFLTDLGGNFLTGGAVANQLVKGGMKIAPALGLEGAFTGGMYGESAEERFWQAAAIGGAGYSIGRVVQWATTPSKKVDRGSTDGGKSDMDLYFDDEVDNITINQAIEDGTNVTYRTNAGKYKTVTIVEQLPNGYVQIKDGSAVFEAVPRESIENVQAGKTPFAAFKEAEDAGKYAPDALGTIEEIDDDLAKLTIGDDIYALDPKAQQRIIELEGEGAGLAAKRFSYIDEAPVSKGRKADEQRYGSWRDATTAGEFFDGVKQLIKDFYNDKLVGGSDFLMKLSPEVGAKFQRFTETALRYNTVSFEQFMKPMEKLVKGADEDKMLKAMVMDYTNTKNLLAQNAEGANNTITTQSDLMNYVAEKYGSEQAGALARYFGWNKTMKGRHAEYLSGEEAYRDQDIVHIHTQLTKEAKEEKFRRASKQFVDDFEVGADAAQEFRTRKSVVDNLNGGGTLGDDYLNPFLTDFRRTANLENLMQMSRVYSLPRANPEAQLADRFAVLERELVLRGMSPKDAKTAAKVIRDDFVGQSRSPNNWIQFLNSWGYAGSLAGPKSAVLNLHDIPMTAVLYGPKSFKGVFKDMGYTVDDRGIRQNVGEFMNYMQEQLNTGPRNLSKQMADHARKGTDLLMRGSFFAYMDSVGKNGVTRMIIQDAVDNVDRLKDRWGFYFSNRELALIEKQIRKHGTNVGDMTGDGAKLFEELFFAGLGQQQLISSAGRPAAWSRNPNMRFMWALRGFAIKQLALAQRNIFDNIAKGNKEAAYDYMKRYALFSAGTFGLLNEARQWIWGDGNFTASGVLMGMADQIVSTASINTIGLNDYQWGKMMEEGMLITWIKSWTPIGLDIPFDTVMNVAESIDSPDKGWQTAPAQFPIINQWSDALQNVEDKTGLVPNPMAQFNKQFIQQELPE
jgi:hypothetical protein